MPLMHHGEEKAEELLRLALDSGNLGIYEWQPESGKLYWDEGVRKIWGVELDAPVSYELFNEGIHPDDREKVQSAVSTALASVPTRSSYSIEYRVVAIDTGVERWVASSAHIQFDQTGRITRVVGVAQDITERKQAQIALAKSEAYFRAVFETSCVGMGQVDPETGYILRANNILANMLGYTPEELVGIRFSDFTHPLDREEDWLRYSKMVRGEVPVYDTEKRYLTKSGEVIWARVTANIVSPPYAPPRTIGIVQEITATKNAEIELHEASRRKDEFIMMLSHELRNPLASIATSASVLQNDRGLAAETKSRLWQIHDRQIKHLIRLIDDLLDATRMTTGKIKLQLAPVLLSDVVKRAVDLCQSAITASGHTLQIDLCDESLVVSGDATRLVQVVSNLLANAVKYTPDNGSIAIQLSKNDHQALLRVQDSGIGMEPEALEHIFDLFAQAHEAKTGDITGLGVGLTLVRGLTEAHGGTVKAFSEGLNRGSEFLLRCPLMVE